MLEGQDIICFSNDWDEDPLSKKHIMTRLAARNRVLWIDSIGIRRPRATSRDLVRALGKLRHFTRGLRRVHPSLHVFSPLSVPFHASALARRASRTMLRWSVRRACRQLAFRDPITWTFMPTSAEVAGSLGEKLLVYHCVDEHSEFTGVDRDALLALERRLTEKADCVVVSSDRLYATRRPVNPRTYLVQHGVDVEHFRQACDPDTPVAEDIRRLRRPVIGFFGILADWVDLGLIRFLADARPQWDLALIGARATDLSVLDGAPNVHLLGHKPYAALPSYAKGFAVAIVPFVRNELTVAGNPLKLREYLAAGLPVVSTDVPEVAKMTGAPVRIGGDRESFLSAIQEILDSGHSGPRMAVSRQMDRQSWDHRVEELSGIVAAVCRQRGIPVRATTPP
jgi:glycosyltransferase involved in cell wall biosynthesis